MKASSLLLFTALLLWNCTDRDRGKGYNFLKTPNNFKIELFSDTTDPRIYLLSWENPIEENDFIASAILLDTTGWDANEVERDTAKRHGPMIVIPYTGKSKDSILFSLKAGDPNSFDDDIELRDSIGSLPYILIDSSESLDTLENKFVFALLSQYNGDNGKPKFTPLIAFDTWEPNPIKPTLNVTDKDLSITWIRPKDFTSIFYPFRDSGLIKGYHIILEDHHDVNNPDFLFLDLDSINIIINQDTTLIRDLDNPPNSIVISIDDRPFFPPKDGDTTNLKSRVLKLNFPDGNPVHPDFDSNKISITFYGLVPEYTYKFLVFAEDSSGNQRKGSGEPITFAMTDTTKPTTPDLRLTENTIELNFFGVGWESSRDTRTGDSNPNDNIQGYHIRRITFSDTTKAVATDTLEFFYKTDTVEIKPLLKELSEFQFNTSSNDYVGKFLFLPPNTHYLVEVWAVDFSNHSSDTSFVYVTTGIVDSTFTCPPGFIPMPTKKELNFFCIESHEHMDSATNTFTRNVDRNTAIETCENLVPGKSKLCTETQWKRACEGGSSVYPLLYGIQSIVSDSSDITKLELSQPKSILQTKCNQAAGDEEMSIRPELRNSICITDEGAYDMAGNLSEWVIPDSNSTRLVFKGGNYLRPSEGITQIQVKAQCNYVGLPRQKRPNYNANCLSDTLGLGLTYKTSDNRDTVFCQEFNKDIRDFLVLSGVDSSDLQITFTDDSRDTIKIMDPADSIRSKPPRIQKYTALIEVEFKLKADSISVTPTIYKDTLEYIDIVNSGIALVFDGNPSDHPVLTRETNPDIWEVIPLKKFFGHTVSLNPTKPYSKVAKPFYSNKVIGFRCCSAAL